MALRTTEDEDTKLNPGQADYDRKFNDIAAAERAGNFNSEGNEDSDDNSSGNTNRNKAKNNEESPTGDWKDNFNKSSSNTPQKLNIKGILKKKGPVGLIVALLGGGGLLLGGGLPVLMGGVLVNFSEILKTNIMDASPTISNIRSKQILRHKMSDNLTTGSCSVITVRCKYQTMSNRQIAKFENAGFKVDKTNSILPGRYKITRLTFDNLSYDAKGLTGAAGKNPKLDSALNKAFNPRFASWSTSAVKNFMDRVGISKRKAITGDVDEAKMKAQLRENIAGKSRAMSMAGLISSEDPDKPGYFDEKSGKYYNVVDGDKLLAAADSNYATALEAKKAALDTGNVSKTLTQTALKSVLIGTGAVDGACTAWNIIRTASFAAKYLGALQLIRYSNVFMNTADAIKAGDATPEEVSYLSDILMSQNAAGKTAMDSRGWNYAMYGDVSPIPNYESGEFTSNNLLTDESVDRALLESEVTNYVNGQITGDSLVAELAKFADGGGSATESLDITCGFVKSGWGQVTIITVGVGALAGCVVTGILTLGTTAGACFTAQGVAMTAVTGAIGITVNLLSPQIIAMATDTLITGDENGNEAGNAIVSGAGAANTQIGLASGSGYLSPEDALAFNALADETKQEFAAIDRYDHSPLDASNPNTFLGSLITKLTPFIAKMSNVSGAMSSIASLPFSSLSSLQPQTSAKSYGDAGECPDVDYEEYATDINCNPIVGQNSETLAIDVNQVLDFMIGTYIDGTTGAVVAGSEYERYLKYCANRTMAYNTYEDGGTRDATTTGVNCAEGKGGTEYQMFRAFQSINEIHDVMDDTEPLNKATVPEANTTPTGGGIGSPENVTPRGRGWTLTDGLNYSGIACAAGTTDAGIYTHPIRKFTIRKCAIGGGIVASIISDRVSVMFNSARTRGINFSLSSGFRSYEQQASLYASNCGNGSRPCRPATAKPGNSQHEAGLALDLQYNGKTICFAGHLSGANCHGNAAFDWLKGNAQTYGFYNLPAEAWHWSTSGT